MHPYKLQIALSTKSTLLFIKRKKCSNLTKSKKRTMVLTIFFRFVSYSERKSDIPSLLLFWPSLLWMPIQAENAWEYYYYEYVWPKLYVWGAIKNQINLVDFYFWVDRAVLGNTENFATVLKYANFEGVFLFLFSWAK